MIPFFSSPEFSITRSPGRPFEERISPQNLSQSLARGPRLLRAGGCREDYGRGRSVESPFTVEMHHEKKNVQIVAKMEGDFDNALAFVRQDLEVP